MCRVLDVSTNGYYGWLNHPESLRKRRHQQLAAKIKAIHRGSREIYDSPRIHGELVDDGVVEGKNTMARPMQHHRIQSMVHKRFMITANSRHGLKATDNMLKRDFNAQLLFD